ncbi:hypothetical protein [Streptomyces sp. B3I8]|uniref:hypothetical protein n=1 Tax=Streptomyces sp. B3I8 TaxID=3042303 RepID=UPI00277E05F7|nr:hypothetical protein [Streptomyces sp. B3I8]MDQ0784650.1 2-polyprenyl-6-methoxyphenol hydroxylase-like FAD-dependent oxidoreductase [Streptomyces sp. B3I8]
MTVVEIAGSGLAELTCARLLADRGHQVRLRVGTTLGPRPLLLNAPTLSLLQDLWPAGQGGNEPPHSVGQDLPDCSWPLTHRQVRWGPGQPTRRIPQAAWALDGALLAARLRERLATHPNAVELVAAKARPAATAEWTVTAAPVGASHWEAGRRCLLAGEAPLASGQDEATAQLHTTALGWLQLVPLGHGTALAQAMVPGPVERPADLLTRLLAESGLSPLLRHPPKAATVLAAAPRLHLAPATAPRKGTPGLLIVGAGAVRFDPLSGTGTAQALRTAVLAAAVIGSTAAGAPADRLCTHYTMRLRGAFAAHLDTCARLYAAAFDVPAWHHELDATRFPPPRAHDTGLYLYNGRLLPEPAPSKGLAAGAE